MNKEQQAFLNQYLSTLPAEQRNKPRRVTAGIFCADEFNANACAQLVLEGKKRATCSIKAAYGIEHEPLPEVGDLFIVLNWSQQPVCIIETTEIAFCPFNQVSREFAESEGEGDGSYEWWHKEHIKFFTPYCQQLGLTFTEDTELVLDSFKRVFP